MIFKKLILLAVALMSQITTSHYTIEEPKQQIKAVFASEASSFIVDNDYERDDVFVADIKISKENGYDVDPTGEVSSTMAIQKAIDDCYLLGGGTVYLPHGKYLVTARIEVKPYVNLRGDYRDPSHVQNGDYGTVIIGG